MTFISNYPPITESDIKGKPYITVSAKGIANGLSDIPNDGADFGPDTLYQATSKDQYGPPYTQTTGIQEAWNYAFASATANYPEENIVSPGGNPNGYWMKPILLLDGIFIVNQKVFLSPAVGIVNPKMIGSGSMSTYVYWDFNDNCIEIDHTNGNIKNSNIEIGYMQPQAGSNVGAGTAFFAANYVSGDPAYMTNLFQSYDLDFSNSFNGYAMLSLTGLNRMMLYNPQSYTGGTYGTLYAENVPYIDILGGYVTANPYAFYLNNVGTFAIYSANSGGNGGVLSNVGYVHLDNVSMWAPQIFLINDNVGYIHFGNVYINNSLSMFNIQSGSSVTIKKLKIDNLNVNSGTFTLLGSNLITINDIFIDTLNIASGASANLPILSSTSGTTAGTVDMRFVRYGQSHKKLIITFSGYENDTTTNQAINYPLPFSTSAIITGNNTGLTISTSTTGITITSPNSTTTYSGIVIVEGY